MTMLEKVARAIWQARHSRAEISKAWKFDELGTATQVDLCSEARAAIEALRTPTEEMQAAADAAMKHAYYWRYEVKDESDSGAVIWRAMIDAALTPAPEARKV